MLASEINYRIDQNLQILNSFVYSNFEPKELWLQFDRIVDKFIDAHFKPEADISLKGVDELLIDMNNLRFLKVLDTSIPLIAGDGNLPIDYRNLLNDRSIVNVCGIPTEILNRNFGDEDLYLALDNPFTTTKRDSPISRIHNGKLKVYTNPTFTVNTAIIDYIRIPVKLYDLNNPNYDYKEFPDECIGWLIDFTRNRLMEVVESNRLDKAIPETTNFNLI